MTLAAEFLRLVKADFIAKIVYQLCTVFVVMAIQAPQPAPAVLQFKGVGKDILVHGECPGVLVQRHGWKRAVMTGHTAKRHQTVFGLSGFDHGHSLAVIRRQGHIPHGLGAFVGGPPP